jgi:hypothetical protein
VWSFRVRGNAAEAIFPAVFENQGNGGSQTGPSLFFGSTLAVRAGDLGTIRHDPIALALEDGREFVVHRRPRLYSSVVRARVSNERLPPAASAVFSANIGCRG